MLKNIIEISLKRRAVVLIISALLLTAGAWSFAKIPIDAFPDVSSTQVKIILKAPGMTPEEVEARVVRPLEMELLGLPGQRTLRSISKYAIADITIDFDDALDIYKARNMVAEKFALVELPSGVSGGLAPIVTPLSESFMFVLKSQKHSDMELRSLLEWRIRPALREVSGVADVNVLGGLARSFVITPQFEIMAQMGVSMSELENKLVANLKNEGAGRVERDGEGFIVFVESLISDIESIKNLAFEREGGGVARLWEFANVSVGHLTRLGFVTQGVSLDSSAVGESNASRATDSNAGGESVIASVATKGSEARQSHFVESNQFREIASSPAGTRNDGATSLTRDVSVRNDDVAPRHTNGLVRNDDTKTIRASRAESSNAVIASRPQDGEPRSINNMEQRRHENALEESTSGLSVARGVVRGTARNDGVTSLARNVSVRNDGVGDGVRNADSRNDGATSLARNVDSHNNTPKEVVEGIILTLKGANTDEVIAGVKEKIASLALPDGVEIAPFYDRTELTQKALKTLLSTLLEALILIIALLFLFLGDVRAALCVALILPLSLAVAFIAMKFFGVSANLMSLGGLVIAIGILVDSAVVIVENAFEKLAHASKLPKLHVIYRSTKSVAPSVFAGVLVIIIFFVPILTLEGLEGKFFVPLAQSIVFAMLGSLALSLTLIPVASSFILKSAPNLNPHPNSTPKTAPNPTQDPHNQTRFMAWLSMRYESALSFCLKRFRAVVATALLFLAIALSAFPFIGSSFMPTLDEGTIVLNVETTSAVSLAESRAIILELEKALLNSVPEIESITARSGSDELGLDPMGLNQSDVFINLKAESAWRKGVSKADIKEAIYARAAEFKGISISMTQPIDMRISEMLTGVRGDLAVKIFGPDIERLNDLSRKISALIEGVEGASDVFSTINEGVNYLRLVPERAVLASVGVNEEELAKFVKSALEGITLGSISTDAAITPVILRHDENSGEAAHWSISMANLKSLMIPTNRGDSVPLSSLARFVESDGPLMVSHENARRFSVVRSNVEKRDLGGFVDEVRSRIGAEIALPEGYTITYGGQFENQERANARFGVVIPLSILAIFFVLFFSFRSIPLALLILLNIPFAATGGLLSLFLSGEYMSVPASVGFIALFGIAVLNGVVMVAHFLELLKMGVDLESAVVQGAKRRLRPVLMTASIAGLGLLPMLLSTGVGSEVTRPLAIVVLGGLVTSTALTLLILPGLFRFVARRFRV